MAGMVVPSEERVYGLATLLSVTSHSTESETKSKFKAHLLLEASALERCPTSAPLRPEKESPTPVTSETIGPTKPQSVTRHHKGCMEGSGPPCSGGPDSRVCW